MEIRICRSCDHDLRWHQLHRPRHQFNPGTSEVVLQPIVAISPSGDQVAIQWPGESKWVQVTRLAADDHSISMVEHGRLPNDWGQTQPNRPSPAEESYQRHVVRTLSGSGFARCESLAYSSNVVDGGSPLVVACNGVLGIDGRCLKAAGHFRPASDEQLDSLAEQALAELEARPLAVICRAEMMSLGADGLPYECKRSYPLGERCPNEALHRDGESDG